MVPILFFYELGLIALVWLFLMLGWLGPHPAMGRQPIAPSPLPRRKRSTAPKVFAGLTTKPPCALCEREAAHPQPALPAPPEPMPSPHRRPRTVDTSQHFCPHTSCRYRGWLGRGNLRANGHPNGSPWRQFQCTACAGYFPEHHGTLFHGTQGAVELIVRGLACLAEGLGIRATARVFEVVPNTVLHWLVEAAEQLHAFTSYFLCEVHVQQGQLDELYTVLSAVKDGTMSEDEAIQRLARSPQWVWTVIDPHSKLLLACAVGPRTRAMAQRVVPQVVQVLASGCVSLFVTDGCKEYRTALLTHFGHWVGPERRQAPGPAPKPRWMPLPQLLYAQVIKTMRRRRLVHGSPRVVFGTLKAVQQVLAAWDWQINTACVERLNRRLRQRVAAIGRRSATPCKSEDGLGQQLALFQVDHNCVLPHTSLRQALAEPVTTKGRGAAKVGRPCTPAMAAGLTDHVWSLHEVLLFRVPPWPQPQTVSASVPADDRGVERLRYAQRQGKRGG